VITGEAIRASARRALAAAAVLGVVLLAGCARPEPPRSGIVEAKAFVPEHESVATWCGMRLRGQDCDDAAEIVIPRPDAWTIDVRLGDDDLAVLELPEEEWRGIRVGDLYALDDEQFDAYLDERIRSGPAYDQTPRPIGE
jgi:hypothetical protein